MKVSWGWVWWKWNTSGKGRKDSLVQVYGYAVRAQSSCDRAVTTLVLHLFISFYFKRFAIFMRNTLWKFLTSLSCAGSFVSSNGWCCYYLSGSPVAHWYKIHKKIRCLKSATAIMPDWNQTAFLDPSKQRLLEGNVCHIWEDHQWWAEADLLWHWAVDDSRMRISPGLSATWHCFPIFPPHVEEPRPHNLSHCKIQFFLLCCKPFDCLTSKAHVLLLLFYDRNTVSIYLNLRLQKLVSQITALLSFCHQP